MQGNEDSNDEYHMCIFTICKGEHHSTIEDANLR